MSKFQLNDFSNTPSIFIPYGLLEDSEIKQNSKLCYGTLVYCANSNGCAFPSWQQIANLMNISVSMVRISLKDLENHGYIKVKRGKLKNKHNVYYFRFHENFKNPKTQRTSIKCSVGSYFYPQQCLYGAYLPFCVLRDTNVSQGAKVCLARLVQHDWKRFREIFITPKELAIECGISITQVNCYLTNLQEAGYIKKHTKKGQIYFIVSEATFFGRKPSKRRKTTEYFKRNKLNKEGN